MPKHDLNQNRRITWEPKRKYILDHAKKKPAVQIAKEIGVSKGALYRYAAENHIDIAYKQSSLAIDEIEAEAKHLTRMLINFFYAHGYQLR